MPERETIIEKIVKSDVFQLGLLGATHKAMAENNTGRVRNLRILTALTVLAGSAYFCDIPNSTATPGPDQQNTTTTEVAPADEAVSRVYSGEVQFLPPQSPVIKEAADANGLEAKEIRAYSIVIDRTETNIHVPYVVNFVVLPTKGVPGFSGSDSLEVMKADVDNGSAALYRETFTGPDGSDWIREGYYSYVLKVENGVPVVDANGNNSYVSVPHTVLEYPKSIWDDVKKNGSAQLIFHPSTENQGANLSALEPGKGILVTVNSLPETSSAGNPGISAPTEETITAPTPFANEDIAYHPPVTPTAAATLPPTAEDSATPTRTETPTPEASYNCPRDPESLNMSRITAEDIISGSLAKWVLSLPEAQTPIAKDTSKINYTISTIPSIGANVLGAESIDNPGWSYKTSKYIGTCLINPSEFGVLGKNDVFLLVSVMTDKKGRKALQLTIDGKNDVLSKKGALLDPSNQIQIQDKESFNYANNLMENGAAPGSAGDSRDLTKKDVIYTALGKTRNKALEIYTSIATTDEFSDAAIDFLNTSASFGLPGGKTY